MNIEKEFPLEEFKDLIKRNIRSAQDWVPIKLLLVDGSEIPDTNGPYYEGKADAFKSVLALIENLQKQY